MDYLQAFLYMIVFFIGGYILLRLIDRFYPDLIVALLMPFVVDIGIGIQNTIYSAIEDVERGYPKYVYKQYCIHRTKKKFGLIPKTELFVWNDNIEDSRIGDAFRFTMGDYNGKAL